MRTYLILSFILYFSCLSSQVPASSISDSVADEYLEEAQELLAAGKLNEPLDLLQIVLDHYNQKDGYAIQLAEAHYYMGICFYNKGIYNESKKNYDAALHLFSNLNMVHRVADCYNGIGNTVWWQTNDNQLAFDYFQKAISTFNKNPKKGHEREGIYYKDLGAALIYLGKYTDAEKATQKSLTINNENLGMVHRNTALSYFMLGQVMKVKEDYFQSANAFEKGVKIYEKIYASEGHPDLGAFYGELGNLLLSIGDYPKALTYFKKGESYISTQQNNGNGLLLKVSIADCYRNLGQYQSALKNYQVVLEDEKAIGYSSALFGMGLCKMDMGEPKEAEKIFTDAEGYIRSEFGGNSVQMGNFYESAGASLITTKQFDKVSVYLNQAISIYQDSFDLSNAIGVARCLNSTGMLWDLALNRDSAIYFYNKALTIFAPDKMNFEAIAFPKEFIYLIWNLGDAYQDKYHKSGKEEDLVAAIDQFQILADYLDYYRTMHYSEASMAFLNEENHILYQRLVTLNYSLYELKGTKHPKALSAAFMYAEKSTAYLLLTELRKSRILDQTPYGDSLSTVNKGIAYYQQEVFKKQKHSAEQIKNLENELFDLKREQEALQKQIQRSLPLYEAINSTANLLTIEYLQKDVLDTDETLLRYFVTPDDIYMFIIQKNKFEVIKVKNDFSLVKKVEDLRNSIYAFSLDSGSSSSEYNIHKEKYISIARELYLNLIAPIEEELSEKLIIVPDDVLGYLPFDVLLKEKPEEIDNPRQYPYMLFSHQMSYTFSATLLQEMKEKEHNASKGIIGFAPEFLGLPIAYANGTNTRSGLSRLDHNIPEVNSICNMFGGKPFTAESATVSNFKNNAPDYKVIHLSTHGKLEDGEGNDSYLAFAERVGTSDNEKLYIRDLYHLLLNADMVVLSACETGLGKLQKGEGILSLGRGFTYAGAKSIVNTLWSVNDESTRLIMEQFYTHLKAGKTKDAALRQAKVDFLKNGAHPQPFYWAAFIPVGDMDVIDFNMATGLWYWLLPGLILSFSMLFFIRKK